MLVILLVLQEQLEIQRLQEQELILESLDLQEVQGLREQQDLLEAVQDPQEQQDLLEAVQDHHLVVQDQAQEARDHHLVVQDQAQEARDHRLVVEVVLLVVAEKGVDNH